MQPAIRSPLRRAVAAAALFLLASLHPLWAALPPGWSALDIGAPALPGSADYANGVWTISASGADICNYDQLHFVWKPLTGDGVISARVETVQNASSAQAGVMFRNDTTGGGIEAAVLATASNGVTFQWRSSAGAGCSYQVVIGVPNLGAPVWVRLARSGNSFSGFWSTNNLDWSQVGSTQTVPMGQTALAGLAVSANYATTLCTATFSNVISPAPIFGIYRELWTGLNPTLGNTLAALTNSAYNPNWPDNPDPGFTDIFTQWETQTNSGMTSYGQRLRAFVVPPLSGNYTFSIASDDTSQLFLSSDESPDHKVTLAWVSSATSPRQWTKEPNQQSAPIPLQARQRYYLETIMQQGTSTDNLALRWQLPNGTNEEPMLAVSPAGTRLIPFSGTLSPPAIYVQPTNQIVSDGLDALFSVLVPNQAPVSYQWQANGTNLPGATSPVCTVSRVSPISDHNRIFTCLVSNALGVLTSAPAVLTVIADAAPPTVARSVYLGETNLQLVFSEPIQPITATNLANYRFTNALPILAAALAPDNLTVTLTTAPLAFGSNYVIEVNGILDRATTPNLIATNTLVYFVAAPYTFEAIGGASPAGILQSATDGYDITAGGRDIGGITDQFQFAYEARSGNFDIKVRIRSLDQTDPAAEAGLMAREDLTAGSRFAAVLATPTINGSFFQARSTAGGPAASSGSLPVNYPDTWLRLQRTGDLFTGYASYDGLTWQQLGSATLTLSNTLYFGMAACSHNPAQTTAAQFRDLSSVTNALSGVLSLPNEPLGPSSRRTGLAITELMYHPQARTDGRSLEFIELFNPQPFFEDISGYALSGEVSFTFPAGTVLAAGAYLVIAANPVDLQAVYGIPNVVGPYTNNLSNSSGTVRLRNKSGAVLLEVQYDSVPPWPASADGAGHSLVLVRPSYGEADPRAWAASDLRGGSPGRTDGFGPEPARSVLINEFLAHTDLPDLDTIELFNSGTQPVDLSGCFLTDDPQTNKFRIPNGTQLGSRCFVAFDETKLGFRLDAAGETIYLINAANSRVLDAVRFEGQANGVSTGRFPDGAPAFRALAAKTLGTNNSPALSPSIVINEIMYDPLSGNDDDQYVELYNKGVSPVDLSGWKFTAGISYTFPANTVLAPDSYLVVAKNASRMLTNYPNLNAANLVGNFDGSLAGRGERLALSMPDEIATTNSHGAVTTNLIQILVNEVTYGTGGRWGQWANQGGSSLELIDPRADNSLAPNWADSDETAKAPWTTVECTGLLDLGNSSYPPDQLQIFLQGAGECLVDNVEVFPVGQTNRITNPNFDTSSAGWYFQGSQRLSAIDAAGGYGGGPCLHLRASGRGDTGANRIRTVLSPSLTSGNTATLRAKVRWLKGNREILLRLHGNWLEAAGQLPIPPNPGTPGARNSRYLANAGPAITGVSHSPILPAAGQPVVVTARVSDPDRVGSVQLFYCNDSAAGSTLSLNMLDTGAGGDAVAGDGIYSATIPGQGAGTMIAFYVQATDAAPAPASSRFPADAPVRYCLVRFGEPTSPGSFGVYHSWVSRTNVAFWTNRERNSNEPLDATFVYGNCRVVYNMQALYSGSPFHTGNYNGPTGSACDYVLSFPDDDRMLGANDFVIATIGNLNSDDTMQREQASFWLLRELGVPSLHRRYIFMYLNGIKRGTILEDAQQPSSDHVEEHFPNDPDGQLHKIEDWFEFDNAGSGFGYVNATLDSFTTTGGLKKPARYRWNWRPRAVQGSANDFTNLFNLVDVLHAARPEPYTRQVQSLVDVEEWMRTFALERFVGNWDSFSYNRGKNMYAYKPEHGRWHLLPWDIDFTLGLGDSATTALFGGHDASVDLMRSHPPFQRAYWRAFQDLVDGPCQDARINPLLDAKYSVLVANGVPAVSPAAIKGFITQRRSFVQSQLNTVSAPFNISSVTLNNNVATVSGTAPVKIKTLLFNGKEYPLTWTGVTSWVATLPLQPGQNPFSVLGLDSADQPLTGASNFVSITYTGTLPSPAGQVVINEIRFNPAAPNTEYVELFNTSTNLTFDLSGWEFRGLSYTFPGGSILGPTNFLVLAADRTAYAAGYKTLMPVFDTFSGALQQDGETLTLVRPGTNAASDLVVAKVRYDGGAPWPASNVTAGASLQLIDARQDNWRAGNWTAAGPVSPQWVYVTATGTVASSTFYMYLESAGDVYLDDIKLVLGSVPDAGANVLPGGDFESGFPGPWTVSANHANSMLSTTIRHSGNASLHLIASSGGTTKTSSIWQDVSPALATNATYTLSFWYLQSTNGGPLTVRLASSSALRASVSPAPPGSSLGPWTPGAPNSVAAALPAFPPLWINELQAENFTGITNRAGQPAPWLELYNPTTNTVSLAGLYLANSYSNLTAWTFPAGATISPRQFKVVFADGQTALSTASEPHTSFTLTPKTGAVALSRLYNGQPQVLDYVNYTDLTANRSYGSFPDGQSFVRQEFYFVTPGGTNNGSSAPLTVAINEWMADNTLILKDPADSDLEDWFELYNYGTNAVDLGGYFLTDTITNKFQFEIPNNGQYVIPPHGFLLVWADGESKQNSTNRADLHTNFKLDKAGEAIGLFGADGNPIDYVTFGPQISDVSIGRYPDGSPNITFLPAATPRANNLAPNTPPVLAPMSDRVITLGQTVSFLASATDADLPLQTLTFSLAAGAPGGAAIHPATGQFSWTPPTAPGAWPISVIVSDNGVPSLSATQTFTVTVYLPPQLQDISVSGNQLTLSWFACAGETYQLEFKDSLTAPQWTPSGEPYAGTGSLVTITSLIDTSAPSRFFRVRVLP